MFEARAGRTSAARGTVLGLGGRCALVFALAASGCFGAPTPVVPLPSIRYETPRSHGGSVVLLMPGRRSRADDFESNGFVAAARSQGVDATLVAVDAHLGYYLDGGYRSLPLRIDEDVVKPLGARGEHGLWLVGTSLGALGSLAYAKQYPERVSGLLLLGPYLGEDAVLDEIQAAGGLPTWQPSGKAGYDYEIRSWLWLKQFADPTAKPPCRLYVGYGRKDSYRRASDILARVLPADRVFVSEDGGHDWDTWLELWRRFLVANGRQLQPPTAQ